MSGPANPSLDQFAEFVESIPPRLGLWRTASRRELRPLLAWLNVWSVQEMRETAQEMGPLMAAHLRHAELHNAVGTGVAWLLTYLRDNPHSSGSQDMERRGFARRASEIWSLRDLIKGARAGAYEYGADGYALHFDFAGDIELEALDTMLELAEELMRVEQTRSALQDSPGVTDQSLQQLLISHGIEISWENASDDIKSGFRERSRILSRELRRFDLPGDIQFKGFTLSEAIAVVDELYAASCYRHVCLMMGAQNPQVACPAATRDELVEELRITNVASTSIVGVVDFLTFDVEKDSDPCLAPIIPVGNRLAPLSELITPGAPTRNLLAKLKADPSQFGTAGKEVGRVGTRTVAEALSRVPKATIATEVSVRDTQGQSAGDLDVVAADAEDKVIVVFEVKWQLEPDGATEIAKVELQALQGQRQLERIADGLANGTIHAKWPAGFPAPSDWEWKWFVVTSNIIPVVRLQSETVVARSHRVLTMMALRNGSRLREVCELLEKPPIPPTADEQYLESITRRFWDYDITVRRPR